MTRLPMRPVQNDLASPAPLPRPTAKLMSGITMALSPTPRALFFDVFGTCVNWRATVVGELHAQSHAALNSPFASLASRVRMKASNMTVDDWGVFAAQWRQEYKKFTQRLAEDPSIPWVSVDEHHHSSLKQLVDEWEISGLWTDEELRAISLIWHRLEPWDDSVAGVDLLNRLFYTCTLSNGNLSLLADLRTHSRIAFTHIFSAELFGTYKPSPRVYLGAAEKLQLPPNQCVMVAAHLDDLKAAKQSGLQTVYVERPGEEGWDSERVERAKKEDWVDLWVGMDDSSNGFVTVAEKLGIEQNASEQELRLSTSAPVGRT